MSINILGINKSFDRTPVLQDISLDIPSGQMVALLGPSGSGKTTLLRIIAGLEHQDSGALSFHGRDVTQVSARDRQVGFVFQHYALFRHMNVFDNVAFGLTVKPRKQRLSSAEIQKKVKQLLEMVQLAHLADRFPAQLSGGQKQRIALARALAVDPEILLLDEPFGALDAQVRKELRIWLRQLHDELKFTSVFVTHDQDEAVEIADRIVVMNTGRIEQVGIPYDVCHYPVNRFVLEFMGTVNSLLGHLHGGQLWVGGEPWLLDETSHYQGDVELLIHPWELTLSARKDSEHALPIQVLEATSRGHCWQLTVQPIGWKSDVLYITLPPGDTFYPQRGAQYYVGGKQARLYAGQTPVRGVMLAKSA